MADSEQSRGSLRPWLENILNKNQVPNVCWIESDKSGLRKFRIPFKHKDHPNWCKEDGEIYKLWAMHAGRYQESSTKPENYAEWKSQLRNALNKAFEFLPDESKLTENGPNPSRIYRMVEKKMSKQQPPARNQLAIDVETVDLNPQNSNASRLTCMSTDLPTFLKDFESGSDTDSGLIKRIHSSDLYCPSEEVNTVSMSSLPDKLEMNTYIDGAESAQAQRPGSIPDHKNHSSMMIMDDLGKAIQEIF